MLCLFSTVVSCILFVVSSDASQARPVIGILSQPLTDTPINGTSYIAASYVKYAEAGGARVVPLIFDEPLDVFQTKLAGINAVLLPGGGADTSPNTPYGARLRVVWSEMTTAFAQGEKFPLWGTCMGFEELAELASGTADVLSSFDAENLSLPLTFLTGASNSALFKDCSSAELATLASPEGVTMNNHAYGVSPDAFTKYLSNNLTALTTSVDRKGKTFISAMEGKQWPIFGSQFHPEKPMFEWYVGEGIDHSTASVAANLYFARFLGNLARSSNSRAMSEESFAQLGIYNYRPVYSEAVMTSFEQIYAF